MSARVVCVGVATQDTIFRVPSVPEPDGRVVATERVVAGGGPAGTAAVTLARLGIDVAFVGRVGDDEAGAAIRDGLASEGVDVTELLVAPGAQSPQSTVLVTGAERAIVHYPGTPPPLEVQARALEGEWTHVDHVGFGPVSRLPPDMSVRVSIDGGNAIPGLDLRGVALYAPTQAALERDFGGDATAALAAGAELVVVTRGADGCVAYFENEVVEAPGVEVEPVSTLGAGDVFHGALLAALVRGVELRDALAFANQVAALSCRALDGRSGIPRLAEVA